MSSSLLADLLMWTGALVWGIYLVGIAYSVFAVASTRHIWPIEKFEVGGLAARILVWPAVVLVAAFEE